MAGNEPRFSPLATERLNEAQRAVAERLERSGRNALTGPFAIMLRSPGMANGMVELYEYYRFKGKLDSRLKELAILVLAREWNAQFEWFAHKPAAVAAGLSETAIEELRLGRRPSVLKPDETTIYDFVIALAHAHEVSDAVFDRAKALLGEEKLVDLISLVGEYMKVALILNTGRVGVPAGNELPLPPLGRKEVA
jgi:4-carboxymuconolactone decarboxylase